MAMVEWEQTRKADYKSYKSPKNKSDLATFSNLSDQLKEQIGRPNKNKKKEFRAYVNGIGHWHVENVMCGAK